jgi:hypothetical protein
MSQAARESYKSPKAKLIALAVVFASRESLLTHRRLKPPDTF